MRHSMSNDTAFNAETTPRHTFLCSDWQCLPPGDPRILCAKHGYQITGKSFIECYARCDWSLPMTYWSTDTGMTSGQTYFLCFVQHGARFWKCFWDYFGLKQVKASKNISQELFTKKKYGETERKRALYNLRIPKLQEIFTTVAIVCHS